MKSSFVIVADRGNLKAFRVESVPNGRAPRMNLVQSITLTEAHMKISDINTDMAGRFPVGSTPGQSQGRHQNAIAEQQGLPMEIDKRLIRTIADHITKILNAEQPGAWCFAAPAMINRAILEELEPALRNQVAENVASDLVNTEPSRLLEHFEGVRAA